MLKKSGRSGQLKWRSYTVITDSYGQVTTLRYTIRGLAFRAPIRFVSTLRAESDSISAHVRFERSRGPSLAGASNGF